LLYAQYLYGSTTVISINIKGGSRILEGRPTAWGRGAKPQENWGSDKVQEKLVIFCKLYCSDVLKKKAKPHFVNLAL